MKKINKILITILFLLITITSMTKIVEAKSFTKSQTQGKTITSEYLKQMNIGDTIALNYQNYLKTTHLLCTEAGRRLRTNTYPSYKLMAVINIKGFNSWNYNTKTGAFEQPKVTHIDNAKLVSILGEGASTYNKKTTQSHPPMQRAYWKHLESWKTTVGKQYTIGNNQTIYDLCSPKYTYSTSGTADQILARAEKYAKELQEEQKITDKTNKDAIEIEQTEDFKELTVGPFKYEFSGTVKEFELQGTYSDGKKLKTTDVKLYKKSGTKLTEIAKKDERFASLKSGEEFYIKVNTTNKVTAISKVKVKQLLQVKTAKMWFLQTTYKDSQGVKYQNLAYFTNGTGETNIEATFDYDVGGQFKISGYVWEDVIGDNKESLRNDLYDDNEQRVKGIKVYLKEGKTTIAQTTTNDNGEYAFVIKNENKLANYHVEFEYNGFTYTNVKPIVKTTKEGKEIEPENSSKAAETTKDREALNKDFSSVEGNGEKTGVTKNSKGKEVYNLTYTKKEGSYKSTDVQITGNKQPVIIASTSNTEYKLDDSIHYTKGKTTEIKNINLGLVRREQPDLAVVSDISSVKVMDAKTKKAEFFSYDNRFEQNKEKGSYQVEYQNKYQGDDVYERPVDPSKIAEITEKELADLKKDDFEVFLTYRIRLVNQSTNLTATINNIINYYDKKYDTKQIEIGTQIEKDSDIITGGNLKATADESYESDIYHKIIIDTKDFVITPQSTQDIFIKFKLTDEGKKAILGESENENGIVRNVTEINSYTTYETIKDGEKSTQGSVYAGIDIDSNPGNAKPEDKTTYEDDTDQAPAMKLNKDNPPPENTPDSGEFTISGTVFEDNKELATEIQTGKERKGNGEYDESDEKGINGVVVQLLKDGTPVEGAVIKTDANGNYSLPVKEAGNYQVQFVWGEEKGGKKVQSYKGTIYPKRERETNVKWYTETKPRYSDALDNMDTRDAIDEEMEKRTIIDNIIEKKDYTNKEMQSTTPVMNIEIQKDENGNIITDKITNVDFGIVERPKQDLVIDKKISSIRLALANGQVLVESKLENGKLETKQHMAIMDNVVKIELDREIMEGAQLEVEYAIQVKNNSELDYEGEEYYKYGLISEKATPVKMRVKVEDYLDKIWTLNQENDLEWEKVTEKDKEDVFNIPEGISDEEKIEEISKIVTYTVDSTIVRYKDIELGVGEEKELPVLKVSKQLAAGEDITIDNLAVVNNFKYDWSEQLQITPNTGEDRSMTKIIILTVALVMIATTIVVILKKQKKQNK